MMKIKKSLPVASLTLMVVCVASAQVGIGTVKSSVSSQLEIVFINKRILIPQVKISGSGDVSTILNGNVNSLLVFNTQAISDVLSGYYFCYNDW